MFAEAVFVSSSSGASPSRHEPVLLKECLELLAPPRGGTAVDCTVGMGGHSRALLEAVGPTGLVVGLDRDGESLAMAADTLREFGRCFLPLKADFRDLPEILEQRKLGPVHALLADFGFSSFQMDSPERGFSFSQDGPLDMRLDRSQVLTAAALLRDSSEEELASILRNYGEERFARRIARAIATHRRRAPIDTTRRLAKIVETTVPPFRGTHLHPATRTFQALRIAVNGELEGLEEFVEVACRALAPSGRAAFIAFHSLEDRAVKKTLLRLTPHCTCPPELPACVCGRKGIVERVNRKALRPSAREVQSNPRAPSARLRVVRRLEESE